ncbi:lysophospholipid acyltransferase family protein [Streptomyces sp. L500]|uniref:lysophospholipid acyltransferase family protein n=1 Tax=Streptomyces abikoensis TaxID=97398 RepID=UPI0036CB2142
MNDSTDSIYSTDAADAPGGSGATAATDVQVPADPWRPTSPCGRSCLPGPARQDRVGPLRRLLRLTAVLLACSLIVVPALSSVAGRRRRLWVFRWWVRLVVRAMGVRVRVTPSPAGSRDTAPGLLVINHTSLLDDLVLVGHDPARPLSKADVRRWPVIGWAAALGRTLYIDRERLSALPGAVAGVTRALRAGDRVFVCPEATTWCGVAGGPYRPAFFQAALDAGVPVLPVVLRYRSAGRATTAAALVGPMSVVESVILIVAQRDLVVEVERLAPLPVRAGSDRRSLARAAERAVDRAIPEVPRLRKPGILCRPAALVATGDG